MNEYEYAFLEQLSETTSEVSYEDETVEVRLNIYPIDSYAELTHLYVEPAERNEQVATDVFDAVLSVLSDEISLLVARVQLTVYDAEEKPTLETALDDPTGKLLSSFDPVQMRVIDSTDTGKWALQADYKV